MNPIDEATADLDITDAASWPALMTVEEVACVMRIQAPTVRVWVREGLLLPVRPELSARAYRFDREYILGRRSQCSFVATPDATPPSMVDSGADPALVLTSTPLDAARSRSL